MAEVKKQKQNKNSIFPWSDPSYYSNSGSPIHTQKFSSPTYQHSTFPSPTHTDPHLPITLQLPLTYQHSNLPIHI